MATLSQDPVLIVGTGPTGLLLALTLAKNAVPVRIIEKDTQFHIGQRGSGVQPRTLEIYNFLGILPDYLQGGSLLPTRCEYEMPEGTKPKAIYDMYPYEEPTPSVPFRNGWVIGQDHNEEILRSYLEKHNIFPELGTELVSFEQDNDGVTAVLVKQVGLEKVEETARVGWLVGADGARSVVRKSLGFTFEGDRETRSEQRQLLADIEVRGLSTEYWHSWGNIETVWVHLRPTEYPEVFQLFVFGREADLEGLQSNHDALVQCLKRITNRYDLEFRRVRWISEWRPNIRMTSKFGEGRVYIAGDAAHVHPPMGAQGMNSGAQDAYNLAWKLSLVYKRYAPPALLESYNAERLPVIAEMLGRTTTIFNHIVRFNERKPSDLPQHRSRLLYMLGINCRWSAVIVDEQPEAKEAAREGAYLAEDTTILFAGDRAPEAPGLVPIGTAERKKTTLFEIYGPTHHTVLIFNSDSATAQALANLTRDFPNGTVTTVVVLPRGTESVATVEGADQTVMDSEGHAHTFYPPASKGFPVIVVRPDGVVGAVVKGEEGLKHYFSGIFSN